MKHGRGCSFTSSARRSSNTSGGTNARSPDAFTATTARSLTGAVVAAVDKPTSDRVVVVRFSDGHALVVELATHGANLVLLEPGGAVVASARNPRAARERIAPGRPWRPRPLPPRQLDPFGADTTAVARVLEGAIEKLRGQCAEHSIGNWSHYNQTVLDIVRRDGLVNPLQLMRKNLKISDLLRNIFTGLQFLVKGKISLRNERLDRVEELEKLFEKTEVGK